MVTSVTYPDHESSPQPSMCPAQEQNPPTTSWYMGWCSNQLHHPAMAQYQFSLPNGGGKLILKFLLNLNVNQILWTPQSLIKRIWCIGYSYYLLISRRRRRIYLTICIMFSSKVSMSPFLFFCIKVIKLTLFKRLKYWLMYQINYYT